MRRLRIGIYGLAIGTLIALSACSGKKQAAENSGSKKPAPTSKPSNSTTATKTKKSTAPRSSAKPDPVEADLASLTDVEAFVKTQKGKVVIVDLWAMW